MTEPANTTLPIELRRELVPVLRYSNYGGPGYAGRLGNETLLQHADINQGTPVSVAELTRTPQGLAQFMKVALQTEPNGYLDSVTRNHDVEYTVAEIRFMNKVQAGFDGRLPHELTAEDMATPAFKQLVAERNQEYWAADQRMLNAATDYQPTDFADAKYRALMVQGFYVKAGDDTLGGEYGIPRAELNGFFDTLKARDPSLATPDSLFDKLGALNDAGNLARSDFEALVTLPLTPQERALFNSHLSPGSTVVPSDVDAQGNLLSWDQRDFSRSIVVPFQSTEDQNIFIARVRMGDHEITSVLDKTRKDTPVFTSETRINGELVSTITKTALPLSESDQGQFVARAYQVEVRDGSGNLQQSYVQEKPEVPREKIDDGLQAKLHAVRTGNYGEVVPEIYSNPFSGASAISEGSSSPTPGQCTPDDPDTDDTTAPLTPDQVAAANPDSATSSTTPSLSDLLPYAQGLNSALSLIQAVQQGNALSAVLAGSSLAGTLNQITDGAVPTLPGELSAGLGMLSTGLNLLDALEAGNELGALSAGANLASQAAGLWANALNSQAASLAAAGNYAECVAVATEASSAAALSNTLGQVAGTLNIVNSLAHGDALGAAIAAVSMVNPVAGIVLSIGRAIFGGLFGDDDDGEPAYVWINATGDGQFVRTEDGGIGIEATGTNRHKSYEGSGSGAGTQGGQAVASALGELLSDLRAQVDAHNAAHPESPMALVPERLPELHYRDPAYYAQWTDADSGLERSIMVSRTTLADDLLAVAQSAEAVVPRWVADTITQRIEAGEAEAWKAEPSPEATGEVQAQDILVLGSGAMDGAARSDIDGDGWREAHAWNPANLYLAVDAKGDGRIEGFDDLLTADGTGVNALGWLDANHDGVLDAADPGFAAIRLWLDANADAAAQDNETATLAQAGIVAIDFRAWPPQLIDTQGNATALTEAHLSGETKGILAQQTDNGVLLMHEAGETVLLAERTTDYAGDEAHTHRETQEIDTGDARLQSQSAQTQATVQTETRVAKDDGRLKSAAPIVVPGVAVQAAVRVAEVRTLGVAPQAAASQELREVTRQMIQETDTVFTAAGGLLAAVAFGVGSAQAGMPANEALPAADPEAATEAFVAALPAAQVSAAAAVLGEPTPVAASLPPAAPAPIPAWTLADLAVAVALPPSPATGSAQPAPVADNASAQAPAFPTPVESVPAGEGTVPAPMALPKASGQAGTDEQSAVPQPHAGDDLLDDRTEDVPFRISPAQLLLNDTADFPTPLRISALGAAEHGRVEFLPNGDIAFTPDADYFGPAAFAYTVATEFAQTAQGRVSFTILPVNDAPTVPAARVDATEDVVLRFDAAALLGKDYDVDNDHADLSIVAVGNPSHGAVFLDPNGAVRFVPEADWFGVAGFDYTVTDGIGGQTTGHIRLDLANVNDAPVVSGETLAATEDTVQLIDAAALLANDADIDNAHGELSVVAVENAVRGTVALDPDGTVRFTPEADYHGAASFDYVVADGSGGASRATVTLDIAAVNDAPVTAGETVAGKTNVPFLFTQAALLANDTDVDQDNLAVVAVGAAEHGTVTLDPDGRVRFVPETGYVGTGGFDYTVADGAGGTATAHVGIDLAHANIAPTAVDDGFTGDEDVPFVIAQAELLANDTDSDNAHADLHITAVGGAQNGTVALQSDGSIRFTPDANHYGTARFSYMVADSDGGQTQATAYLHVQSVNDAPVVTGIDYFSNPNYLEEGRINAYDPDGDSDSLTYVLERAPVHGTVNIGWYLVVIGASEYGLECDQVFGASYWYYNDTFGDPYSGADPFEVKVIDADGASTTAWIQTIHRGSTAGGGGGGGGGCPIAIDLNGNGVDLIAPDDSRVFEDINNDGWRDRIGWIGADDGLLALDRDGDGRVGSFREISFADDLPGAHTDLEGLRAHDSDGDGFLDADDAEWSRFGIWRDANGNGVQEDGELRSLDDMGVARIGLTGDGNLRVDHGNVVFGETRVELRSGESMIAADVMFAGQDVPYPTAVREALAAIPPGTAPPDEAELARLAQAFVQACAVAAGDAAPLGFVDAASMGWPAPAPDWHAPAEPAATA